MNKVVFEIDGRYDKCIIFDGKSYALLEGGVDLILKGNTIKGRSNEAFVNQFIKDCMWHVFNEEQYKIREEYDYWYNRIENKEMTPEEVCKRENINMSLEEYRNKIAAGQSQIATYEAALNSDRPYTKGDVIVTWIEEPKPVLKEYKTRENEWKIPKGVASYELIRLESEYNGNIYRNHYHSRLKVTAKTFLVVLGLDGWELMFNELSILKPDKIKLLPVLGLEKFMKLWPEFGFNKKAFKKLNEKDKEKFASMINNNYLSKKYEELL